MKSLILFASLTKFLYSKVGYPKGALACCTFLSCLEVLIACEESHSADSAAGGSSKIAYYSLFTASLWAYAREKLLELGER